MYCGCSIASPLTSVTLTRVPAMNASRQQRHQHSSHSSTASVVPPPRNCGSTDTTPTHPDTPSPVGPGSLGKTPAGAKPRPSQLQTPLECTGQQGCKNKTQMETSSPSTQHSCTGSPAAQHASPHAYSQPHNSVQAEASSTVLDTSKHTTVCKAEAS